MVAATRNVLAGFFFMLMLMVYIPALMIAHVLKRRGNSSKFTTYVAGSKERGSSPISLRCESDIFHSVSHVSHLFRFRGVT